ncbi:Arylsulfatase A [Salegentibacter holothuriorum]|uniref:Arylsulfatase A n=1 Tax=Salegentibacter holothuriorum TaxID=241145 RepID=A0A1T5DGK9_9FLAO|nr:arylsulfatase [Salegentibacter holothuriorum]SKB70767.1 Arylsulfatase A [Salegentibacter holothuriorum]
MKKYISIAVMSLILSACGSNASKEDKKPNIVFIMADDLGIGDLGVYGQDVFKTPNIDQLATEGMKFENFYAGSTVCAPSRAALLTGQHTGSTQVRGNGEFPLDPDKKIIPEILKEQGYTTGMYGKWGLGLKGSTGSPEKRGWDEFLGHLHHVDAHFQRPDSLDVIQNGKLVREKTPENSYANELFTDAAVDFIEERDAKEPFFLYLSFTIPHAELVVPDNFIQKHLTEDGNSKYEPEEAWPEGRHYAGQKYPKAAYAALVESIDAYVGRVMEVLKEKGYDENTMVVFTSDNGTHLEGGRRQADVDFFKSSGEHRGVKRDLYEGGIKEPFIVRWPAVVEAGTTSDFKGAFWDVYPTFSEIAGVSINKEAIDGISFLPTLKNSGEQKQHDYLYWEFHEFGGKQALLKGDWKVIRLNVNENPQAPVELYNIAQDPAESKNLAESNPEKAKELQTLMDSVRTPNTNFNFKTSN